MFTNIFGLLFAMNAKQITALLAAVAAVATVLTLAMPVLSPDVLGKRMKSVALEREKIRQRERERLARGEKEKVSLRAVAEAVHGADRRALQPHQVARPGERRAKSWCRPAIAARRPMWRSCSSA